MGSEAKNYNWPDRCYLYTNEYDWDGVVPAGTLGMDGIEGAEVATAADLDKAIRIVSGKDSGHHQEGVVAVYQLVELITIRQKQVVHHVKPEASQKAVRK